MQQVRRFADPEYAKLSLAMRDGRHADAVFDRLVERGQVVVHPSEAERTAVLAAVGADGALVVADTREQVATLNAAIRNKRPHESSGVATDRGELIGLGDRVATRRNDPALGVTNRQTWTVVGTGDDGSLIVHSPHQGRDRELPAAYVREYVELAYATTIHGAQGETVDHAHVAIGEATGAAAAYVARPRADSPTSPTSSPSPSRTPGGKPRPRTWRRRCSVPAPQQQTLGVPGREVRPLLHDLVPPRHLDWGCSPGSHRGSLLGPT